MKGDSKMDKAKKYIDLLQQIWGLPKDVYTKMTNNSDLIEKEFDNYLWDDIKWAVQKYYTHKSDKTFPKICHIVAILEATGKRVAYEEPVEDIQKPTTNIRAIQDVFMVVCQKLYMDGIFYNEWFDKCEHLPYGNKIYIKDEKIMNKQWIWDDAVSTFIRNYPQEYNKFKQLSLVEKYVFAYKYGCFNVKDNYA